MNTVLPAALSQKDLFAEKATSERSEDRKVTGLELLRDSRTAERGVGARPQEGRPEISLAKDLRALKRFLSPASSRRTDRARAIAPLLASAGRAGLDHIRRCCSTSRSD